MFIFLRCIRPSLLSLPSCFLNFPWDFVAFSVPKTRGMPRKTREESAEILVVLLPRVRFVWPFPLHFCGFSPLTLRCVAKCVAWRSFRRTKKQPTKIKCGFHYLNLCSKKTHYKNSRYSFYINKKGKQIVFLSCFRWVITTDGLSS